MTLPVDTIATVGLDDDHDTVSVIFILSPGECDRVANAVALNVEGLFNPEMGELLNHNTFLGVDISKLNSVELIFVMLAGLEEVALYK